MNCPHLKLLAGRRTRAVVPRSRGCEECLASGDPWVHLRLCMSCGHVGCCDSSPNQHATRHHHETGHEVVRSFEPGEDWAWCYADEEALEGIPTLPGEATAVHLAPGGHAPGGEAP